MVIRNGSGLNPFKLNEKVEHIQLSFNSIELNEKAYTFNSDAIKWVANLTCPM